MYVVFIGTIVLVELFSGEIINSSPEHITAVWSSITGLGLICITISNESPSQCPPLSLGAKGVTVYVRITGVSPTSRLVCSITAAASVAGNSLSPWDVPGKPETVHSYTVPLGTILAGILEGSNVKLPPEHIGSSIISSINGSGSTWTTISKGSPGQAPDAPEVGVTV